MGPVGGYGNARGLASLAIVDEDVIGAVGVAGSQVGLGGPKPDVSPTGGDSRAVSTATAIPLAAVRGD
jgi:hypothetical protein